jgi:hypothetical protein
MGVTLYKNLRGILRPLLVYNAMDKQTAIAPEKDYVAAAQRFRAFRADHGDVPWPNPGHHARAMNAERNTPAYGQRFGNSRSVARASLAANLA